MPTDGRRTIGRFFGDLGAMELAKVFERGCLPKLQLLDLRCCYIGQRGIQHLSNSISISNMPSLKALCLGGNMLTDDSLDCLRAMLRGKLSRNLEFLGLEDNFITSPAIDDLIHSVAQCGFSPVLELELKTKSELH